MEQLKKQIAAEAIRAIARHYNTTEYKVSLAMATGNKKVTRIVNAICEGTLNNLYTQRG